jgi:hypothetical protein
LALEQFKQKQNNFQSKQYKHVSGIQLNEQSAVPVVYLLKLLHCQSIPDNDGRVFPHLTSDHRLAIRMHCQALDVVVVPNEESLGVCLLVVHNAHSC